MYIMCGGSCSSSNKTQQIKKKYDLKEFKFQYSGVCVYFIRSDFIRFLKESTIEYDEIKSILVSVFVYNETLSNDIIAKKKYIKLDQTTINQEFVIQMIDDTLESINWETITKNNFNKLDISFDSLKK